MVLKFDGSSDPDLGRAIAMQIQEFAQVYEVPLAPPIVDLGCGHGNILVALSSEFDGPYIGIEDDPSIARIARQWPHLDIRERNITDTGLETESVGFAYSNSIFDYARGRLHGRGPTFTLPAFSLEVWRILKPGGVYISIEQSDKNENLYFRQFEAVYEGLATRIYRKPALEDNASDS